MNIFELLPRQDDSGDEDSRPAAKSNASNDKLKSNQGDRKETGKDKDDSKSNKKPLLRDGEYVWARKEHQPLQNKMAQIQSPTADQPKTDSKDKPENDDHAKSKKKRAVRVVESTESTLPAQETTEDIILLDQYLKDKYNEQETTQSNIDADSNINGDLTLTEEMKKLGLKPLIKKQFGQQQPSRKTKVLLLHQDNKALVKPSVFTLGNSKMFEDQEADQANQGRHNDYQNGERDNRKSYYSRGNYRSVERDQVSNGEGRNDGRQTDKGFYKDNRGYNRRDFKRRDGDEGENQDQERRDNYRRDHQSKDKTSGTHSERKQKGN